MSFDVPADAYSAFMGRYSRPLSAAFADLIGVRPGHRVLDVGCGPGALTEVLARRVGADNVAAIDPSESFLDTVARNLPGVAVARGSAEQLPYPDEAFDVTAAQLVVHFMADPIAGLRQMARVTRPGGTVAANVWNFADGRSPLSVFWRAVRTIDPSAEGESNLAGVGEGRLAEIFVAAGMTGPSVGTLSVRVPHTSFDEWWNPYTYGVGPAGDYVARLAPIGRERLRRTCQELLPLPPFTIEAVAWTVCWRKPVRLTAEPQRRQ